ncbi:MAG: LysR family transcriptional regulator, partial [Paracoccaceae bacterium]|nr:LysR family transcriptional regulator [Paracoccaceae bacterium]
RISFGSSDLGLEHLLAVGGSAYLPDRVAAPLVRKGRLHNIKEAPEFERPVYLSVNSDAAENWPWLNDAIAALG